MNVRVITLVVMTYSAGLAVCQTEPFLDVTALKVPNDNTKGLSRGGISGGCLGHTGRPCYSDLPVKITVLRVDKLTFHLGERIVLEVRLENVGNKPVSIPWTVDGRLGVRPNPRPDSVIVLAIKAAIEVPGELDMKLAPSIYLSGSLAVPGTYRMVPPGGTARLRVPVEVLFSNEKVVFPLEAGLRAQIRFLEGPLSHDFHPATSGNVVAVMITPKP